MPSKSGGCGSCAFFGEHAATQASHEGLCRFNPPVSQTNLEAHGLWPVMTEKDWCGHFAPDAPAGAVAAE